MKKLVELNNNDIEIDRIAAKIAAKGIGACALIGGEVAVLTTYPEIMSNPLGILATIALTVPSALMIQKTRSDLRRRSRELADSEMFYNKDAEGAPLSDFRGVLIKGEIAPNEVVKPTVQDKPAPGGR